MAGYKLFYSFLISPLSRGISEPSHTSGLPVLRAEDGLLSTALYCHLNILTKIARQVFSCGLLGDFLYILPNCMLSRFSGELTCSLFLLHCRPNSRIVFAKRRFRNKTMGCSKSGCATIWTFVRSISSPPHEERIGSGLEL